MVPVYKEGGRSLVSNYRPISLTSVLCKALEPSWLYNDLAEALKRRAHTDVILLDLSKAFDTVPHNRLHGS